MIRFIPRRYWAVIAVALALTMSVLDGTIVNVALPTLSREFGTSPSSTIWIVNAYQLTITMSLLSFSALGDIYGYKRIFLIGTTIFCSTSLFCALSSSFAMLTVARILQGIGASAIMSVTTALLRIIYPPQYIGRGMSINAMVVAVSIAAGPSLAGAILSVASWNWLFAINVPFGPYIPGSEMASGQNKSYSHKFSRDKINIIRSMDLLVIDEVSMVRADLLDAISDMLRRYRDRNKPFGGVQLLLIGDLQQLAPVAKEDEWNLLREHYASPFFFDSKALSESDYLCIELTQVYRQADDTFVRLLNNIRENRFDENTLHTLNQRYIPNFKPNDKAGYITLTTHNYQAQQINNRKLQELPGPAYTYKAEIKDDFPAYSYPTDEVLELKQDAQVMFVKNDSSGERRYYNGKIGRIVFISPSKIIVSDELGNDITVDRETWTNVKYTIDENTKDITETIAGSFSQYPLKTAWAITIHKSQGLTFEHAIIDASAAFSHGQVYVALSRCKTLEGMVLSSPITRNAMISDEKILSYTSSLSERQPCEDQLRQAQQQYYLRLATELFDFNPVQQKLQYTSYAAYTHLQKLYPELSNQYPRVRDYFRSDIVEVGERFCQQLTRMISSTNLYDTDEHIQDRIRKGCAYFLEKIETYCLPLIEASDVEIDNKEARKAFTSALKAFSDELTIKVATLKACQDGFRLIDYLSAKAKANIEESAVASKQKSTRKSTEAEKIPVSTDVLHPELYARLKQWRYELAVEKELPPYTILQQKALIGVCNTLPTNSKELLKIPGIGKKIIENYGETLLEIVSSYSPSTHGNGL